MVSSKTEMYEFWASTNKEETILKEDRSKATKDDPET